MTLRAGVILIVSGLAAVPALAGSQPVRARNGMVVSQHFLASQVGIEVLWDGGGAVDAAVATAFALAVTYPNAGNIGGGGFLLYRPATGEPVAYDFREKAPARATPTMFLKDGKYDSALHHDSYLSVGVPGTVAGLHMAWRQHGRLSWRRLVEPAIVLARDGFVVTDGLARSLQAALPGMKAHPATLAQFSREGSPYEAGDILKQPDLARTLERIAARGPAGFYEGETAELVEKEMAAHGGLITRDDLRAYEARRRAPLKGTYRGFDVLAMPPVSAGGTALLEMLNVLEGYDLAASGFGSAITVHRTAEAMRRAFADRAPWIGDPESNPQLPIARLVSQGEPAPLRPTILARDGKLFLVLGSPGGRKIPSVVLLTILNVVDFGMNVQEAVDAPRFHHQWLPDRILHEKWGLSPDTRALLAARGHTLSDAWPPDSPTGVQAILYDAKEDMLEGAADRRSPDTAAVGR